VVQYYNAMQIGAFEVLDAKQRETEARREHVEALEDAWLARIDLESCSPARSSGSRRSTGRRRGAPMPAAQGGH
jgi:hypothetical protein